MKIVSASASALFGALVAVPAFAGDTLDLDDVANWKLVSVETCLDQALDTIPGNPRKREVKADDATFKSLAKVSQDEARKFALAVHPGKVVAEEFEIGQDGEATYEFDIQTVMGPELKVDVSAETGKIEEANVEIYEIGTEAE